MDGLTYLAFDIFERPAWPDLILALAALVSGIGAMLGGWAALRRTRMNTEKSEEEKCLERIRAAYAETERLALELHEERMK